MIDYLFSHGFAVSSLILEYSEISIYVLLFGFLYTCGRVEMSLGIFAVCVLARLGFDNFWLFFAYSFELEISIHLWYTGFGFSCFALILSVYLLHLKFRVEYSVYVIVIMLLEFLSLLLQCSRYIERVFFDTGYLSLVYRYGIPGINISAMLVFCLGVLYAFQRRKTFSERIPWKPG